MLFLLWNTYKHTKLNMKHKLEIYKSYENTDIEEAEF